MLNPGDQCAVCGKTDHAEPDLTAELDAAEAIVMGRLEASRGGSAMTEPFMDGHPNRLSLHDRLRREPDDVLITGWDDHFTDVPNVTCADTADGLRELLRGLNERCEGHIDPAYIEDQITHEGEHARAAAAVGFSKVRYGLGEWVTRTTDNGVLTVSTRWQVMVFHVAPVRPFTKLGYAAIMAAPRRLSDGDLRGLRELGYRDAEDVSRRVARYNDQAAMPLPQPGRDDGECI